MKQLEVQIMGQSYRLGCPEGAEARFQATVARVDEAMCKIRDAGKVKARDRIAVLAALNLAFDLYEGQGSQTSQIAETPVSGSEPVSATLADPDLSALIARLDAALGDDGRLI